MRTLLVVTVLLAAGIFGYLRFLRPAAAPVPARAAVLPAEPVKPKLSLEERAAAAQGTTYPVQRPDPPAHHFDSSPASQPGNQTLAQYRCDGRVSCSQMHSCDEARWFLQNCPGTKMDGDHDGLPCEDVCGH